jgi:hypothetical protein
MKPMESLHTAYETSDLHLASFLRCRGFRIQGIKRQNNKATFAFEDGAELREAVLDFANDGTISARSFSNTLRDLKALAR